MKLICHHYQGKKSLGPQLLDRSHPSLLFSVLSPRMSPSQTGLVTFKIDTIKKVVHFHTVIAWLNTPCVYHVKIFFVPKEL